MKRVVWIIVAVLVGLGLIGSLIPDANDNPQSNFNTIETLDAKHIKVERPICDGTSVKSNCTLHDIDYETYVYHPAIPEKSHTETVTTYKEKITGYCTLCRDGTYSPSCATGRGACSWHGGVAQWNAPIYRNVPEYSTKKVIDVPAQKAYYEKVLSKD